VPVVLMLGLSVSNPWAVPRIMYVASVILTSVLPSSPSMELPVKPPKSLMLTDLATSPVSLDTSAVTPEAMSPVEIVVSDPIGAHFTAVVAGSALLLIVTLAVPAGSAPGGREAGADEHAPMLAAIRAAAVALKNRFCTSSPRFLAMPAIPSATEM
jgi:hypothetical protein